MDLYGEKTYRFCNLPVTENERVSLKKQLILLKMYVTSLLCDPRVDLRSFYGL